MTSDEEAWLEHHDVVTEGWGHSFEDPRWESLWALFRQANRWGQEKGRREVREND